MAAIPGNILDRRSLKAGDLVYAYAYRVTSTKENSALKQEPIRGAIANFKTDAPGVFQKDLPTVLSQYPVKPRFFVPYRKNVAQGSISLNSDDFMWSRAVLIESRHYADTPEKAWEGYLELVHRQIAEIDDLKKPMYKALDDAGRQIGDIFPPDMANAIIGADGKAHRAYKAVDAEKGILPKSRERVNAGNRQNERRFA